MIHHALDVQPGKIAIVRERISDLASEQAEIFRPVGDFSESADWKTRTNPWALVVAVGPERILDNGRALTTNIERGDKICVGQVGMSIPLTAPGGEVEQIWLIPFEAAGAILTWACSTCDWRSKREPENAKCPICVDIVMASLSDVQQVKATR